MFRVLKNLIGRCVGRIMDKKEFSMPSGMIPGGGVSSWNHFLGIISWNHFWWGVGT